MIEACFKEQALGGFHNLVKNVLNRPKLKSEVFKDKKIEEDNYRKIREAVRDCGMSFCMAAAYEFKCSSSFPDPFALRSCFRSNGNHNKVILDSFITWLDKKSEEDTSFRYCSRMFLHYGPLMELFDYSTHNNFGIGRETVYMVQLPSFAQLGFRNYYSEVFVHVVNFLMKWPIAFRRLLQQNCSINLSWKKAKGIELDCWIESQIVKPTKKFLSGHSTVKTCTTLGGSVDLASTIKNAYKEPKAFDDHSTTRHSVSSPLRDQLKGTWFCVSKGMFDMNSKDEEVSDRENSVEGFEMEKVPKMCINVDEKGRQKLKNGFKKKLFDSFPDIRFVMLENKEET